MATPRADKTELERIFRKVPSPLLAHIPHTRGFSKLISIFPPQYATIQKENAWFMTQEDFVCRYLQLADSSASKEVLTLLSEVADTSKDK